MAVSVLSGGSFEIVADYSSTLTLSFLSKQNRRLTLPLSVEKKVLDTVTSSSDKDAGPVGVFPKTLQS